MIQKRIAPLSERKTARKTTRCGCPSRIAQHPFRLFGGKTVSLLACGLSPVGLASVSYLLMISRNDSLSGKRPMAASSRAQLRASGSGMAPLPFIFVAARSVEPRLLFYG